MNKVFLNLTNGLEFLPELSEEERNTIMFTYIASTTLENKSYIKLLVDLDHNLLFNLAIGNECFIVDYGTNRPFSKTIYLGIPLIRYCLTRFWLDEDREDLCYRLTRNGSSKICEVERFKFIYDFIFNYDLTREKLNLKTKLKKYKKKFLRTSAINLHGYSISTCHDGKHSYYKALIEKYL